MSCPYPPKTLLRHMGPHNYKVLLCRPRFSHTRRRRGVSLWFSGQRLLTDGTSENSVMAKFSIAPAQTAQDRR